MNRRKLLTQGLAVGSFAGAPAIFARTLTPTSTTGPFYPNVEIPEIDADLTTITGRPGRAMGDITDLSGRLLDANGNPVPGARIEIWQCDVNGRYRHTAERSRDPIDRNFQGFGFANTSVDGTYRFRTIKPVPYPGRTPHIHFKVLAPDHGRLVTQMYIAGEKRNRDDFLFQRLTETQQSASMAKFEPNPETGLLKARFDIVISR